MLTPAEAMAAVLRAVRPARPAPVPLADCVGRTLRETVRADRPQPPYDRVTMDGYALSSGTWSRGVRNFAAALTQRAGEAPVRRRRDEDCVEVMTGAPLPLRCDTVVPLEDVVRTGGLVRVDRIEPGRFIHRTGSDVRKGSAVLRPGARLDGPALGIAAAVGRIVLKVSPEPRIAIIGTGDEVVPLAVVPAAHQIRPSNAHALAGSLRLHGWATNCTAHIPDDPRRMKARLARGIDGSDVLVLTGGVSKGRFDFIPAVLRDLGVQPLLHGVAQQPGKPMWFGTRGATLVFGLPGNPVSALVCLHRYVLPALAALAGRAAAPIRQVRLSTGHEGRAGFTLYRPVRVAWAGPRRGVAEPVPMKNSGDFFPLAGSDGFVEIPPSFRAGGLVDFHPWSPQ